MKAVVYHEYGEPSVLELAEIDDRVVGSGDVLIRLAAASVNPVDWKTTAGYLAEYAPVRFPAFAGSDVSGTVVAIGDDVSDFQVGDDIIGAVPPFVGAFSELVPVAAAVAAKKPAGMSFADAACLPTAGLTALASIRAVNPKPGDTVIVNGAAGGIGSFAVQLARTAGARVVGICSPGSTEYVTSLGAEPVTYGADVTSRLPRLEPDVTSLIDTYGGESLKDLVALAADPLRAVSVAEPRIESLGGRYLVVAPAGKDIAELAEAVVSGQLRVNVAQSFPIRETRQAYERLLAGGVHGKVALDAGEW
ncbi:NADP-dependent oxidoreductase [Microtetraspora niveoalba]|uniref:NADP-dependent oxidoreductase n=1 Tax=Microtetraspora niveoalba TaxID=46175 RepID=UPI00082A235D|nr:NADP-dependent oxidoreductase [Microtetraspora niveoalba]